MLGGESVHLVHVLSQSVDPSGPSAESEVNIHPKAGDQISLYAVHLCQTLSYYTQPLNDDILNY